MRFLKLLFLLIFISSCSSKKNLIYLQDINDSGAYNYNYEHYKLKIDDILKIDIGVVNPDMTSFLQNNSISSLNVSSTLESQTLSGYKVDKDGNIFIPFLGQINVINLSLLDLKRQITSDLKSKGIINEPLVNIKLLNGHFTILGEVNMPGTYNYTDNDLNIFEAIGMAGDLTINGVRKKIKIIRKNNDKNEILTLDITTSKTFESAAFQIYSGDIIIINPNTNRIKNAGIIGNSGTLLSLLSFILSSIIVASNT